jgi:hypothetical protein
MDNIKELENFTESIKKIIYVYGSNLILIKKDIDILINTYDEYTLTNILNKKLKICNRLEKNGLIQILKLIISFEIKLEILKMFEKFIFFNRIDLLDIALLAVNKNINENIKEYLILKMNDKNFMIEI